MNNTPTDTINPLLQAIINKLKLSYIIHTPNIIDIWKNNYIIYIRAHIENNTITLAKRTHGFITAEITTYDTNDPNSTQQILNHINNTIILNQHTITY